MGVVVGDDRDSDHKSPVENKIHNENRIYKLRLKWYEDLGEEKSKFGQ